MPESPGTRDAQLPPRPLPATYWVVPGRFLAGEHPGSQSRAEAMDRLRRFLVAGITCFVDLTEPGELPSYEALLPFATPEGRRVEYLREPIRDHGVPAGPEVVARAIAMIDDALDAGHVVYLHCRAGIGRSATVVGCWLAGRAGAAVDPLDQLQELWQQSVRSRSWPEVPETEQQVEFVRDWTARARAPRGTGAAATTAVAERIRGALIGLALGDASGAARRGGKGAGAWTQHTAMALCLAESLLERGDCDARDQMERYLRWQRDGHLSVDGRPTEPTPDVARALATYQWRGLPMAGSHDPRDRTTASLPRAVSAAAFALDNPAAAVALAAECARTTHQSPLVLDACRFLAALLVGALRGDPAASVLARGYEPVRGLWAARPLRAELLADVASPVAEQESRQRNAPADVLRTVDNVRAAVATTASPEEAIRAAVRNGREPALDGALAGALAGALWGAAALPEQAVSGLARLDLLEQFAARLAARQPAVAGTPAVVRR